MKKIIISFLSLIFFFTPLVSLADGMVLPPDDYYIYESDQRAVILYEKESKTETMVISIKFQGDAKDFAWVVPVPNKPEISKGSDELFISLADLTNGNYYTYSESADIMQGVGGERKEVEIIEQKRVDYYNITTLTSTDSRALAKWLNKNGYQFPSSGQYVFNSYINNNWYFVAIKIDTSALGNENIERSLRQGQATPLKLKFKAENLVYPLKISSVIGGPQSANFNQNLNSNANEIYADFYRPSRVNIELYILADHKKYLPHFTTSYANWVKRKDIEKWAVDEQGNPLLTPEKNKYFLTKLRRSMAYSEMNEDLFPRDADNNKKVGVSSGIIKNLKTIGLFILAFSIYSVIILNLGIFSPFGLLFIILAVILFTKKNKVLRIFAWLGQFLVSLFYLLISVFFFFYAYTESSNLISALPQSIIREGDINSSSLFYSNWFWSLSLILPVLFILALFVFIMVWQLRFQRKKENKENNLLENK